MAHLLNLPQVTIELSRSISLLSCILVALITVRLAGVVAPKSEPIALAVLLSTYGFLSLGFSSMVDMTFAFWIWVSVYPALLSLLSGKEIQQWQRSWLYAGSGMTVLCKGPLGAVFSLLVVFLVESVRRGFAVTVVEWIKPRIGWIYFIAIACSWYALVYLEGGTSTIERQIWFENFGRLVGNDRIDVKSGWYYLPSLLRFGAPWSWFAIAVALLQLRNRKLSNGSFSLLLPILVLIGLLSLSAGKRHSYLVPIYPLITLFLFSATTPVSRERVEQFFKRFVYSAAVLVGLILFVISIVVLGGWNIDPRLTALTPLISKLTIPLGVSAVILVVFHLVPSTRVYRFAAVAAWTVALVVIVSFGLRAFRKGYREAAEVIAARVGDAPLAAIRSNFDERLDPVLFYLMRRIEILPVEIDALPETHYIFAHEDWFARHPDREILKNHQEIERITPALSKLEGRTRDDILLLSPIGDIH